jgi:hypothetical protein
MRCSLTEDGTLIVSTVRTSNPVIKICAQFFKEERTEERNESNEASEYEWKINGERQLLRNSKR